ncbi:U6 snRNA-associated Sm-like protein LSm1 [Stegodyphus dumicola]|uniref:U6 snRNA-associated Sm-like protein LSm1 n=1 Tax=Stegodyphus dumicola TaxID=202533 RepID=UPI0015B21102|nr:U6 snRNA-associated Sm-like protein LSm1 [Stegodyphus dumicola]
MSHVTNNRSFLAVNEVVSGAASLLEHLDKQILVWLRDGRMFLGYLRSVDQFANLVMHNATERIHVGADYGDIPQGVLMVRGENVVLLGEIGDSNSSENRLPAENILVVQAAHNKIKETTEKLKMLAYWRRGLVYSGEDTF